MVGTLQDVCKYIQGRKAAQRPFDLLLRDAYAMGE